MIFSYNWLKEFTGLDIGIGPDELSDRLTMSGVEVEGVHPAYERLNKVYPANYPFDRKTPGRRQTEPLPRGDDRR